MKLEVRPNGDVLVQRRSHVWVPLLLLVLALPMLLLGVDVFTFECDRSSDRCTYSSVGALHGGSHSGELRLSSIDYLSDEPEDVPGAQQNERFTTVLHTAALTDGALVELEGRRRYSFIDDGLRERFIEFERSGAPRLSTTELHLGFAAWPVIALMLIGLVFLVLARSVRLEAHVASRSFTFRRRGVLGGFASDSGRVDELAAVEINSTGNYRGVYLAKRDGRRLKLSYGSIAEPAQRQAAELAAALGLAHGSIDDATVRRHATGVAPWGALGCMLLALSPLAVPLLWCLVSGLLTP